MRKINLARLLHTLVPFMVMTIVQRLLLLVFGHFSLDASLSPTVCALLAFLPAAGAAVLLFRLAPVVVPEEEEEIPPLLSRGAGETLLRTLVTMAAMVLLSYAVGAAMGENGDSTHARGLLPLVSLLIVHPVVEEWLFRHLFYGELRRMNPVFGCMAQALMFAIIHDTVDGMVYALVSGVALAILYEQSGRLWAVIVAHAAVNLRGYCGVVVFVDNAAARQTMDIVLLALGGAALLGLAVLGGRRYLETTGEGDHA